jgi:hypothetical protein
MGIVIDFKQFRRKRPRHPREVELEFLRIMKRPMKRMYAGERRAAKIQRTPAWADLKAIEEIYLKAAEMSKGAVKYHVDHIIPLRGALVSGLHVEGNLQIITAAENTRKCNKWEPE